MSKLEQLKTQAMTMINSLEPDMSRFETAIEQAIKDKKLSVSVDPGTWKERELLSKHFTVVERFQYSKGAKWEISFQPNPQPAGRWAATSRHSRQDWD